MLKVDKEWIKRAEEQYPGITKTIRHFEKKSLPACSLCGSENTADVQCGVIGRTIHLATATTKFKLIANGPILGQYFCNACGKFFGTGTEQGRTRRGKNLNASDLVDMLKKHGGFTVRVGGLKRRAKRKS